MFHLSYMKISIYCGGWLEYQARQDKIAMIYLILFVLGGMVLQSIGTVPLTFIDDSKARIIVEIDIDVDQPTYNFMLFLSEPSSIVVIGPSHHIQHYFIKWLWIFLILIGLEGSLLPLTELYVHHAILCVRLINLLLQLVHTHI